VGHWRGAFEYVQAVSVGENAQVGPPIDVLYHTTVAEPITVDDTPVSDLLTVHVHTDVTDPVTVGEEDIEDLVTAGVIYTINVSEYSNRTVITF